MLAPPFRWSEGTWLAQAHEIVGFRTTMDTADRWAIGNDGNTATYDVQAVLTHEWGHIAGLDVVSKPR